MIESLKLTNSDFELVSDYPAYSLFFVEYSFQNPDGIGFRFDHPADGEHIVKVNLNHSNDDVSIFKVEYNTGYIDGVWFFTFENDKPYIQANIERTVIKEGVYSNFQQCTMYNSDMDQSYIINYSGNIECTMGQYDGDLDVTYSGNRWTTQHSMWTAFNYGDPKYLPTMAWKNTSNDIYAGIITTSVSPNQFQTMSYHGGGSTKAHPGYAEAQWNWFGKSDSEALYLRQGTRFSMQMIFYQGYGSIDTLFHFAESLLSDEYLVRNLEDYSIASWAGRTSTYIEKYYWVYPQVSNNFISSQELWRHKAMNIPLSQNGTWDNHFFNVELLHKTENGNTLLSPIYGIDPVFSDIYTKIDPDSSIGIVSWNINNIPATLSYTAYQTEPEIKISGTVDTNTDSAFLILPLAPRTKDVYITKNNDFYSIWGTDNILDTLGITLFELVGFDTSFLKKDTLFFNINNQSQPFSLKCQSFIKKIPRTLYELKDQQINFKDTYKSYYISYNSLDSVEFLVNPDIQIVNSRHHENLMIFSVLIANTIDKLYFRSKFEKYQYFQIYTNGTLLSTGPTEQDFTNGEYISFPFIQNSTYDIILSNENIDAIPNFEDLNIICYPNPVYNTLNCSLINNGYENINLEIKLFSLLGRKMYSEAILIPAQSTRNFDFDFTKYSNGIYFLTLNSKTIKIVKKIIHVK